jgi:hypothetical protein
LAYQAQLKKAKGRGGRMIKRCFICKGNFPTRPVLMIGPTGFRRYEICAKCEADQAAKKSTGTISRKIIRTGYK